MAHTFDLVPVGGVLTLDTDPWNRIQFHLRELVPATNVRMLQDPPRIRVRAQGRPDELAPGLLTTIEELAGTRFDVVLVRRW